MRTVNGQGGRIYALGEPYKFKNVLLQDCGTGWDWRAEEGLRYWLPEELSFEVCNGEWRPAEVVEIHHRLGRVGFNRCLSGLEVRASGTCFPTTLVAEGETWKIGIETVFNNGPVLGGDVHKTTVKMIGATATITDILAEPLEEALAWLPTSTEGTFVGIGKVVCQSDQVQVIFDSEGVSYGNR